jgi:hypothetical protein
MINTSIGMPWNKDERTYSVSRSKEFGQDTVQQFNLSRGPDEFVINESTGTDLILYAFE